MSQGPGRVERAVAAFLDANQAEVLDVFDIVRSVFPDVPSIELKHVVSVRRATKNVMPRMGWSSVTGKDSTNGSKSLTLYFNDSSPESRARARGIIDGHKAERERQTYRCRHCGSLLPHAAHG